MKKFFLIFIVMFGVISLLSAQEMILNGGFENEDDWTIYNLDSSIPCTVEFGVDDGYGPTQGEGSYLKLSGDANKVYINILVWQELALKAGTTYQLTGAFKDLTLGDLNNFWCELILSTEAPVDGKDWTPPGGKNTDDRLVFNTWDGCGSGIDGTFQNDGCGANHSPFYTPPGNPGDDVIVYFGIKTGIWTDAAAQYYFIVGIDNISLVPQGAAVQESVTSQNTFCLYPNFPNPFNSSTTIRFSVGTSSEAVLSIFDINGRSIRHLMNARVAAGIHSIKWDGLDDHGNILPSGVYLYQFNSGTFSEKQRMVLIK